MNVDHHSSRAATANALKQGQWRFHDLGKFLDGIPLLLTQRKTCRGRDNQHAPAVFLLNLQYIPGETLELLDFRLSQTRLRSAESRMESAQKITNRSPILMVMSVCNMGSPFS